MAKGSKRRIVFMGTPAFAAPVLKALLDSENDEVVAVYTRPDKKAGRGLKTAFSDVKKIALEHELPIYQPASFRSREVVTELNALEPDYLIVAAYGLILPQEVLDIPKVAPINVHASLLPALRGAAPIQRAIMENPKEDGRTGVSIMKMLSGLDTGPVYGQKEVFIGRKDYKSLEVDLAQEGAALLLKVLDSIEYEGLEALQQDDSRASYAKKLEKSDGLIDWSKTAAEVDALVRAVSVWPGAQTSLSFASNPASVPVSILKGHVGGQCGEACGRIARHKDGLSIACGDRWYEIEKLRPQGRKTMSSADFANGQIKACFGICGHAVSSKC